jgi:hypothetical protein
MEGEVVEAQPLLEVQDTLGVGRRRRVVHDQDGVPSEYVARYIIESKRDISKLVKKSVQSLIGRRIKKGLGDLSRKIAKVPPAMESVAFESVMRMDVLCEADKTAVNDIELRIADPVRILELCEMHGLRSDVITDFHVNGIHIPDVTDAPTPLPTSNPTGGPTTAGPTSAPSRTPTAAPTGQPTPKPLGCAGDELECFAEGVCLPCDWRGDGWEDCSDGSDENPDKLCVGEYPIPTRSPTETPTPAPTTLTPTHGPTPMPTGAPTTPFPTGSPTPKPLVDYKTTCDFDAGKSDFSTAKRLCEAVGKTMCTLEMLEATCQKELLETVECKLSERRVWASRADHDAFAEGFGCASDQAPTFQCGAEPKCKKKGGVSYAGRCCEDVLASTTNEPTPTPTERPTNKQTLCKEEQFRCLQDDLCVPCSWVGDTFDDCQDKSDESAYARLFCRQSTRAPTAAPTGVFVAQPTVYPTAAPTGPCADRQPEMCGRATRLDIKCKSDTFLRECMVSCGACTTATTTTSTAVPTLSCEAGYFPCAVDSVCLPCSWANDGTRDCTTGEDETSFGSSFCKRVESAGPSGCPEDQFRCASDGVCLPCAWTNDGSFDCTDGTDELAGSKAGCSPLAEGLPETSGDTATAATTLLPPSSTASACLDLCQEPTMCQTPGTAQCFQTPPECFPGGLYTKQRCCDTTDKKSGPDDCWYGETDFARMIQFSNCCGGFGQCQYDPVADGTPCDDGSVDTSADICANGVCQGIVKGESRISFATSVYVGLEREGAVSIEIKREGNITGAAEISLFTESPDFRTLGCGGAEGLLPGLCDYVTYPNEEQTNPIHFDAGESAKSVRIVLGNDESYEGDPAGENPRVFHVFLSAPLGAALGPVSKAAVQIRDDEDLNLPTLAPTPLPTGSTGSPTVPPTAAPTSLFGYSCDTDSRCAKCTSPTRCAVCNRGLLSLDRVGCVEECPSHHVADYEAGECIEIYLCTQDIHCHECGSETACRTCKNQRYLLAGGAIEGCVASCPASHKPQGSGNFYRECVSVCDDIPHCQRCSSGGTCASCRDGLYLLDGSCRQACPATHAAQGTGSTDRACAPLATPSPTSAPTKPCDENQFSCFTKDGLSGQLKCLPCMWANDGIVDCLSGYDESSDGGLAASCPGRFPGARRASKHQAPEVAGEDANRKSCRFFTADFYLPSAVEADLAVVRGTARECEAACCRMEACAGFSRSHAGDDEKKRCWLKGRLRKKGRIASGRFLTWVLV